MHWLPMIRFFFAGVFLSNAVPHFVCGVMGKPFQSPFARPSGIGLSSSTVNLLWGCFNLLLAYLLLCRAGDFDLRLSADALPFGLGILAMGLFCARHFGSLHGGNTPRQTSGTIGESAGR